MRSKKELTFSLVLLFFTTTGHASFFGLNSSWPHIVDNSTQINSHLEGITAYFEAGNKNKGLESNLEKESNRERGKVTRINNLSSSAPYFKQSISSPRTLFSNIEFNTWANIRLDSGTTLLDGAFEVFATLELDGVVHEGLAFSASLIDVAWDEYTIAFKTEIDQHGYLCDLGLCSFSNELVTFNLTSGSFDGNFSRNLELGAQTVVSVSAVPVPAAVWLFGSAVLGLGSFKRIKKSTQPV